MHGMGLLAYPDRRVYIGEFKDNKRNGDGISAFPNGEKYADFKNNKRHGQGTLTHTDGKIAKVFGKTEN